MPARQERVRAGNRKQCPAPDVPHGGERQAMLESDGNSQQPALQRRRVEETLQQPKWTLESPVRDILLEGSLAVKLKLNDFLRGKFCGMGVVESNESVLMEEFAAHPTRFIDDTKLLDTIKTSESYNLARCVMEWRKGAEMITMRDVAYLHGKGVSTLKQWWEFEDEGMGGTESRQKLDRVLHEVRMRTILLKTQVLEGLYESVYNARWSHVMEAADVEAGMGLKVKEGKPPQSWEYKEEGGTLEIHNEKKRLHPPRLRLMVLSSERQWPYSWSRVEGITDCYVTAEVERVWKVVEGDLKGLFGTDGPKIFKTWRHLLIGTSGIGKSMAAGSYLLYQLLHYDAAKFHVVVYCFGRELAYVFDKTAQTVSEYKAEDDIMIVVKDLAQRGMRGYVICDAAMQGAPSPAHFPPSKSWGMILVSSPDRNQFEVWKQAMHPRQIIMNCPDAIDVKAMYVWERRDQPVQEQAECWKMVEQHMCNVGPIPLCIFSEAEYVERFNATEDAVKSMSASDAERYSVIGTGKLWHFEGASHQLLRLDRKRGDTGCEAFLNVPICEKLWLQIFDKLATIMGEKDVLLLVWRLKESCLPEARENYIVPAFTLWGFVGAIQYKLKELTPPEWRPRRPCALRVWPSDHPKKSVLLLRKEYNPAKVDIKYGVLYEPEDESFPLLDAFFFLKPPQNTMVGLQVKTSKRKHITASIVRRLSEYLAEYFNVRKTFALDLLWEIIYVHYPESVPINRWQRCDLVQHPHGDEGKAEEIIAAFWKRQVHQYNVAISPEDLHVVCGG
ncbi:retrotransposon hot spot (RHS) protein [Trypanosoma rangeli]|uniref:Retrotransposon hot spot (RHS) protein n=1 Tax=Trypanosoma rangeli TaxID=5698 RepID=A0A3R7KC43_TRYRA|nr:retrotransposon hot spot (RHS) protein [Trypanosoma rangeli]RNE97589.1 retrotransposon hot spot (RHS) protein [Trypanosoma rangeli]|eukprot:RNE97589.1 retrotransposon hot spot (RHS) protein [Trypanosoma rangeli]